MRKAVASATGMALAIVLFSDVAQADEPRVIDTQLGRVHVETVVSGLSHPWGLAFLPDGRFLVTERNTGQLRIGNRKGELSQPVENVPDVYRYVGPEHLSQGGLFHVALHPEYIDNRLIYVSFSQPSTEGAGTAIARGRLVDSADGPMLADVETVFSMNLHDSGGLHFGGRFVFEPDTNNILLSIGDRQIMARAQAPQDHAGKILRITDDGAAPPDNPFFGQAGKNEMIYSMGHRNIEGMALNPRTSELWINDQGPRGGDEINLLKPGRNYGWPIQTAGTDTSGAPIGRGAYVEGFEPPVYIWESLVTPSGLAIYDSGLFEMWRGDLLHGALAAHGLVRTRVQDGKVISNEIMLTSLERRIRDVAVDAQGAVWLLTDHDDGEVLRLTPEDPVTTGAISKPKKP